MRQMSMDKSKTADRRRERFLELADRYKVVVAKVCSIYASPSAPFADLYQEVMLNLWSGLDSYSGAAKMSTWIYRLAINTCITWHRRNRRHVQGAVDLDCCPEIAADPGSSEDMRELYRLISLLEPFDKALLTLWLDEKTYDEMAAIMGISKANVATRLHRIREKLTKLAHQ